MSNYGIKNLIMPALCSYTYSTHYAQNYASIIRKTLVIVVSLFVCGLSVGLLVADLEDGRLLVLQRDMNLNSTMI